MNYVNITETTAGVVIAFILLIAYDEIKTWYQS